MFFFGKLLTSKRSFTIIIKGHLQKRRADAMSDNITVSIRRIGYEVYSE